MLCTVKKNIRGNKGDMKRRDYTGKREPKDVNRGDRISMRDRRKDRSRRDRREVTLKDRDKISWGIWTKKSDQRDR